MNVCLKGLTKGSLLSRCQNRQRNLASNNNFVKAALQKTMHADILVVKVYSVWVIVSMATIPDLFPYLWKEAYIIREVAKLCIFY